MDVASELVISIYGYLLAGNESHNPLLIDTLKSELSNLHRTLETLLTYIAKRGAIDNGFLFQTLSKVIGPSSAGLL